MREVRKGVKESWGMWIVEQFWGFEKVLGFGRSAWLLRSKIKDCRIRMILWRLGRLRVRVEEMMEVIEEIVVEFEDEVIGLRGLLGFRRKYCKK